MGALGHLGHGMADDGVEQGLLETAAGADGEQERGDGRQALAQHAAAALARHAAAPAEQHGGRQHGETQGDQGFTEKLQRFGQAAVGIQGDLGEGAAQHQQYRQQDHLDRNAGRGTT